MPLFTINHDTVESVASTNFAQEVSLQRLVEKNLNVIFNCRFVASEFMTGVKHGGRIDTLALSEDSNPVIIEYKKVESSELINQSLYYLAWIQDHRGDFEMAVQRKLGANVEVDWSDLRVICIAPGYRKYDLHAVEVMGANIELWRYRLFENSILYLEEVFGQSSSVTTPQLEGKNPIMVEAGKKAAITRATGSYTFEEHIQGKPEKTRALARAIQEYILSLDDTIEEAPKKLYVAYKTTQNIACMEIQNQTVRLFLKLKPTDVNNPPANYRDVTYIGHFGTGDAEFNLHSLDEFEATKPYVEQSYRKVGG
jgi:predicted transport protein